MTWSGAPANEGETSANSSLSLRGFSTMPTTVRRTPSSASGRSELEPQELRHSVGDGDLAAALRVAALAEREELAAVGAVRILRPEVHLVDAAGDGNRAVADDVRRPERLLGGGEPGLELARIGAVELEHGVGRAELGVDRELVL